MKDGFIKVAAAAPEMHLADCAFNAASIIASAHNAAERGADLFVTPELSITGYTCGDLFFQRTLQDAAEKGVEAVLCGTAELPMLVAVGAPVRHLGKLYNCAVLLYQGQILGVVPKSNLPNYDEFQEMRLFSPAPVGESTVILCGREARFGAGLRFACAELPAFTLGLEICEDLWVPVSPSVAMCRDGATVIANLCASHDGSGKAAEHRALVASHSRSCHCAYILSNAGIGESTGDLVFSGRQLIAENGALLAETKAFSDDMAITEIDVERLTAERCRTNTYPAPARNAAEAVRFSMPLRETKLTRPAATDPYLPSDPQACAEECACIFSLQTHALARRMKHIGASSAVIGVSGGLDSTLALLAAHGAMKLLGKDASGVTAVTMPCFGTSVRTRDNAGFLCKELGITLREIPIGDAVSGHFADIGHDPENHNVTFENAQARERTQILMDLANENNGLVVGTGDLSELALGWATYNGDHMSMYGVNAGIPKTQIRKIVRWYAETCGREVLRDVLLDILDTPVSPELLPPKEGQIAQKTEDLVGPYELHDFFLYYILRWGFAPRKILRLACYAFAKEYDRATILHWMKNCYRRFLTQQYKRSCMPDGPMVGPLSLSPRGAWRMPSDAFKTAWMAELEEL